MKLQPIIYTTDSAAAVDWYGKLLDRKPLYQSEVWSTFDYETAYLAIHLVDELPAPGRVVLSTVATEPLEAVIERLAAVGITPDGDIIDQPFGRSIVFRDPDGSPVQVNEDSR